MTKPTLYYHFHSKLGLLETLFSLHGEELLEKMQSSYRYDGDLLGCLVRVSSAYLSYMLSHEDIAYLVLSMTYIPASHEASGIVEEYQGHLQRFFVELFIGSVAVHGNLKGHEQVLSSSIMGVLNNYAIELLNKRISYSDRLIEQLVRQYMYGIYVL